MSDELKLDIFISFSLFLYDRRQSIRFTAPKCLYFRTQLKAVGDVTLNFKRLFTEDSTMRSFAYIEDVNRPGQKQIFNDRSSGKHGATA